MRTSARQRSTPEISPARQDSVVSCKSRPHGIRMGGCATIPDTGPPWCPAMSPGWQHPLTSACGSRWRRLEAHMVLHAGLGPDAACTQRWGASPWPPSPRQQPSQLSPQLLTARLQACIRVRDIVELVDLHSSRFNEVHVMCAVSRLAHVTRYIRPRDELHDALRAGNNQGTRVRESKVERPLAMPQQLIEAAPQNGKPRQRGDLPAAVDEERAAPLLLLRLLPLALRCLDRFTTRQLAAVLASLAWIGMPEGLCSCASSAQSPFAALPEATDPLPRHLQLLRESASIREASDTSVECIPLHRLAESHRDKSSNNSSNGSNNDSNNSSSSSVSPMDVLAALTQRCSQLVHSASADDACRMLWAAAKLGRPDAGLLEAAAAAALAGAWPSSGGGGGGGRTEIQESKPVASAASSSLAMPIPARLIPTFLWAVSRSPAEQLHQTHVKRLMGVLLMGTDSSSSNTDSRPPLLGRMDCLASMSLEGLTTALYSISMMCAVTADGAASTPRAVISRAGAPATAAGQAQGRESRRESSDAARPAVQREPREAAEQAESAFKPVPVSRDSLHALCASLLRRSLAASSTAWLRDAPGEHARSLFDRPCDGLRPRAVANASWALMRLGHVHGPLLDHLVAKAEAFLKAELKAGEEAASDYSNVPLIPADKASRGQQCSTPLPRDQQWPGGLYATATAAADMAREASSSPEMSPEDRFSPQELANTMSAMARLGVQSPGLLEQTWHWILCNTPRLGVRDASELLYAVATMLVRPRPALPPILSSSSSPPSSSSTSSSSSARPGKLLRPAPSPPATRWRDDERLDAHAVGDGRGLNPKEVSPGTGHAGLSAAAVAALADAAARQLEEASPQQVVGLLWALTRLGQPHAAGILKRVLQSLASQAAVATATKSGSDGDQSEGTGSVTAQGGRRGGRTSGTGGELAAGTTALLRAASHVDERGSGEVLGALLPLAVLHPEDVSRLCWSLAAPGALPGQCSARAAVLQLLEAEATEWCRSMENQSLVMTIWSFATLRHPCPTLVEAASREARARLTGLSSSQLPVLLWALARLLGVCGAGSGPIMASMAPLELLRLAAGVAADRVAGMAPRGVVMVAWAYASSGVQPGDRLTDVLSSTIAHLAPRLSPHCLGSACWAISRLEGPHQPMVLQALADAALNAIRREESFACQEGAGPSRTIPAAAATATSDATSTSTAASMREQRALQQQLPPPRIDARALAAIAVSLARSRSLPGPLRAAIARRSCMSPLDAAAGAGEAVQLLWALASASGLAAARHEPLLLRATGQLVATVVGRLGLVAKESEQPGSVSGLHDRCPPPLKSRGRGSDSSTAPASADQQWLSLPGGHWCMLLSACATLGYHPGEIIMEEAARQLAPHVASLSSHTLCEALASLASLGAGIKRRVQKPDGLSMAAAAAGGVLPPQRTVPSRLANHGPDFDAAIGTVDSGEELSLRVAAVTVVRPIQKFRPDRGAVALLVRAAAAQLTARLCTQQQELLTLGSVVNLAWALACLPRGMLPGDAWRHLRRGGAEEPATGITRRSSAWKGDHPFWQLSGSAPKLLVHAAAKALGSPPEALNGRPVELRRLLELRGLLSAELQPKSTWRALSRRWAARLEAGGADRLPPGLMQLMEPEADRQRERACAAQVHECLLRLGLAEGTRWSVLPYSGDRLCVFEAWPDALSDRVQAVATASTVEAAPGEFVAGSGPSATFHRAGSTARALHRSAHLLQPWTPAPSHETLTPRLQRRPELLEEWGSEGVAPKKLLFGGVSRRFALYLVNPSHLSCDDSQRELACSELRGRVLRPGNFAGVVAVRVSEWSRLMPGEQDEALRGVLQGCLTAAAALAVAIRARRKSDKAGINGLEVRSGRIVQGVKKGGWE